jgi:hypothetical protein
MSFSHTLSSFRIAPSEGRGRVPERVVSVIFRQVGSIFLITNATKMVALLQSWDVNGSIKKNKASKIHAKIPLNTRVVLGLGELKNLACLMFMP